MGKILWLLAVLACWLALSAEGLCDDPAMPDYFPIPVQSYATVDISGNSTNGKPVTLLALDDSNNAAFAFETNLLPYRGPFDDYYYGNCVVKLWSKGAITGGHTFPLTTTDSLTFNDDPPLTITGTHYFQPPNFITSTGTVFGNAGWDLPGPFHDWADRNGQGLPYKCDGGTPQTFPCGPDSYFTYGGYESLEPTLGDGAGTSISVSSDGSKNGGTATFDGFTSSPGEDPVVLDSVLGYIALHATVNFVSSTAFDDNNYLLYPWPGDKIPGGDVLFEYFNPSAVNKNGWAIGSGDWLDPWHTSLWDPTHKPDANQKRLQTLDGIGTAINDDNDVLVYDPSSPYLMQKGDLSNKKYFLGSDAHAGMLSTPEKSEFRNIYPSLMSNRVHPTDSTVQPVLYIVFGAEIRRSAKSDTWEWAEFLLTLYSDETTDVHEITTIDVYGARSINSSGVIAAIGNGGHALLLVPYGIAPDYTYGQNSDGNQTNSIVHNDISVPNDQGNIGAEVKSIFAGDPTNHPNPEKHFVSPKNTLPGPVQYYVALKSGIPATMANQFEWVTDKTLNGMADPRMIAGDASTDALITRATPDKIRVQLRKKGAATPEQEVMNVWIVWATATSIQHPNGSFFTNAVNKTNNNISSEGIGFSAAKIYTDDNGGFVTEFTIQPESIVTNDPTADIPNLKGGLDPKYPAPPSGNNPINGRSYAGGATMKWDATRSIRTEIINPGVVLGNLPKTTIWQFEPTSPVASDMVIQDFPTAQDDPLGSWGTDDTSVGDEDNNPYKAASKSDVLVANLCHAQGAIRELDAPRIALMSNSKPTTDGTVINYANEGDNFILDERFADFLRLQIGSNWYRVSNHLNWYFKLNVVFHDGKWANNGSYCDLSAPTD